MTEPAVASERVAETEPGADPDLSLNPHLGHMDPDQKPDGKTEPEPEADQEEQEADSPSAGEDNAETKPDDDAIKRKVGELAYENRQLKRQLEERRQKPEEEKPEPLKTLKDFNYDEQAFNGYLVEEGAKLGERRARAAVQQHSAETEAESNQREFQIREDAFEAENPGFKERLHAKDLMISQEMAAFIADPASEVGLHVGDYLARNKTEAARIAGMAPLQQNREMVKLEATISKEVAKAKAAKTSASKAPEPPTGIDGTNPGVKTKDPSSPADADKMSDEEWQRQRAKQLEARRNKK